MANNISSMLNSKLRFSGMASGLDTDSIIKQLMRIESMKVDKVKQDRQMLEWKRDNYRDVTNLIRGFKDSYLDVLKPETNFRSASAFATFDVASGDESVVTAKALAGAASKTHSITVTKLATAAKIEKTAADYHVTDGVVGSGVIGDFNLSGKQIIINYDGTSKAIALGNYDDIADLASDLQTAIGNAIGTGKIGVAVNGTSVEFESLVNGSTFSLSNVSSGDGLEKLGFTAADNKSNRISLNARLDSIENYFSAAVDFNSAANVSFVINGTTINLNKTFSQATIQDVMSAVNASSANVELKYDSLKDKFALVSKGTGVSETISFTDTSLDNGLFKALGIEAADLVLGKDAEFDLDGITGMKRGSNEFIIDGVSYALKGVLDPVKAVSISVKANTDALVGKIKEFVGKYNELIDKLNTEYSEKRDRDYLPLTDEQKESMGEEDIKKWEEKTKAGLLKGDSILGEILGDMRRVLYDPIDGAATSLYKIGITTGTYEQKGKLLVDEDKLKAAITNNIDAVTQLFTKSSEISYEEGLSDSSKRQTRYAQSGLGERLFDVIQDNIRTTRDDKGYKGALLEKAGITGDLTEFKNTLSEEIGKKDTLIDVLLDKLFDKEDALYRKFAAMETALNQMNSQSAWMAQQFGGSQQ